MINTNKIHFNFSIFNNIANLYGYYSTWHMNSHLLELNADVIFAILFILFWYFNYSVLLSLTGSLFGITPISPLMEAQSSSKVM